MDFETAMYGIISANCKKNPDMVIEGDEVYRLTVDFAFTEEGIHTESSLNKGIKKEKREYKH